MLGEGLEVKRRDGRGKVWLRRSLPPFPRQSLSLDLCHLLLSSSDIPGLLKSQYLTISQPSFTLDLLRKTHLDVKPLSNYLSLKAQTLF